METVGVDLVNLIGSVGFPIVACIYMAWLHNETENKYSDERAKMTETLTKMNAMLDSIYSLLKNTKEG